MSDNCLSCTISYKCVEHSAIQEQGKIIADYGAVWKVTKQNKIQIGEEWYVMFPDGSVQIFTSKKAVEKAAKAYFKKNVEPGKVGIGKIEWRT